VVAARAVCSAGDVVAGTTAAAGVVWWSWLEHRLAQRDRAGSVSRAGGRAGAEPGC
jgi:hypothetical protein